MSHRTARVVASLLAAAIPAGALSAHAAATRQQETASITSTKRVPVSTKPKAFGVLRLNSKRRFPASAIPKVKQARDADRLGGQAPDHYLDRCPATSVDLGTYCLDAGPYPTPPEDEAKADYAYATVACRSAGGFLPSAAMLFGAAGRIRLASTVDDSPVTASVDEDATDGLKDAREMTADVLVTRGGAASAGSHGVSSGATGNPRVGEPNPVPQPADPEPESLQYLTVYDNHNKGGWAGAQWVGAPAKFRCAYLKSTVHKESAE